MSHRASIKRIVSPPFVALAILFGMIGLGLAIAARSAVEPPNWDALSYVQKALTFWQAIGRGSLFNPFDLEPTVRPPGTVLMSYPFGFGSDYRSFYFRSSFIPIILLVIAVFIVGYRREATLRQNWGLAAISCALIGLPLLYQFQPNDDIAWDVGWGMVDGFLASVAAIALACADRSARLSSIRFAIAAVISASFCFLIKPSGALVMALVGVHWLLVSLAIRKNQTDPSQWRAFFVKGLGSAFVIYGLTFAAAFRSQYFSPENILFGQRVIAVMSADINSPISFDLIFSQLKISFGYPLTLLTFVGICCAIMTRNEKVPAVTSIITLAIGAWFWLISTEPWEPRYFVPFGVMALVGLIPALLILADRMRIAAYAIAAVAVAAPTVLIVFSLFLRPAPLGLQQSLGINLATNLFSAENKQAEQLLSEILQSKAKNTSIFSFDITAPLRNVESVLSYAKLVSPVAAPISITRPVDWQRRSAFRIEDMLRANYLAFMPTIDEAKRNTVLSSHNVPDFYAETELMNAWATELTPSQGVEVISQTRVKILRVTNHSLLEKSLDALVANHNWPQTFMDANPQRWWSGAEVAEVDDVVPINFGFKDGETQRAEFLIHAASITRTEGELQLRFWVDVRQIYSPDAQWVLFAHIIDAQGNILRNAQVDLIPYASPYPDQALRLYQLRYELIPPNATAIAVGFFSGSGSNMIFLRAGEGQTDWDGRRLIIPMPRNLQ